MTLSDELKAAISRFKAGTTMLSSARQNSDRLELNAAFLRRLNHAHELLADLHRLLIETNTAEARRAIATRRHGRAA